MEAAAREQQPKSTNSLRFLGTLVRLPVAPDLRSVLDDLGVTARPIPIAQLTLGPVLFLSNSLSIATGASSYRGMPCKQSTNFGSVAGTD